MHGLLLSEISDSRLCICQVTRSNLWFIDLYSDQWKTSSDFRQILARDLAPLWRPWKQQVAMQIFLWRRGNLFHSFVLLTLVYWCMSSNYSAGLLSAPTFITKSTNYFVSIFRGFYWTMFILISFLMFSFVILFSMLILY